jgi:hypothetical protein
MKYRKVAEQRWVCLLCNESFWSRLGIKEHLEKKHNMKNLIWSLWEVSTGSLWEAGGE